MIRYFRGMIMEGQKIQIENGINKISKFPNEMNEYFDKKEVVIKIVQSELDSQFEMGLSDFQITSADQYFDYLTTEITYWEENDKDKKIEFIVQYSRLKTALDSFNNALRYYEGSNKSQGDSYLDRSVSAISQGTLYSKTNMAKFLLENIDKNKDFFVGIKYVLDKNRTYARQYKVVELDGIITALNYQKEVLCIKEKKLEALEELSKNIDDANKKYAELTQKYTMSLIEHEKNLNDIVQQTNNHFDNLSEQTKREKAQSLAKMTELETLYEEKLRLQAPAQYWEEMEKNYRFSGTLWLIGSFGIAVVIVFLLSWLIQLLPETISIESNWTYIFKMSAILTVITSIGVYILRLSVKMATSSFHLARDAKERNRLTYFYLALIQNKAVTDKERAIILNSLFSRSDTGLLKGDSSPVMSGNVTDLINSLNKQNG